MYFIFLKYIKNISKNFKIQKLKIYKTQGFMNFLLKFCNLILILY